MVMKGQASTWIGSSCAAQRCLQTAVREKCNTNSVASRRLRRQHLCTASARQSDSADGGEPAERPDATESIDDEWRQRRWGSLWTSLAEQDRSWAVHSYSGGDFDSGSTSTIDDGWDIDERMAHSGASWATRTITLSPSSSQQTWMHGKRAVYVILFGVGSTDTEGIYSLRVMSREERLPQDTIIAFSTKEDAERYAGLLEATMEHMPTVIAIEPSELLDFCDDSGYSHRVEADGSLLIPPDYYVTITDWERSLRLREGKWTVMERDLIAPSSDSSHCDDQQQLSEPMVGNNANLYPLSESSYVLEEQRARLERLAARD